MNNIDISIIVPVYNVEQYLKRCIDSILSQTFTNFELILVNDGSNDKSGIICDEYKKIDNRIKVIHKENGGLSSARNAGIDIAKGKYIGFVDSDDYIHIKMYETLYKVIVDNDSDLAVCSFNIIDEYLENNMEIGDVNPIEYNNINALKEYLSDLAGDLIVAWNKLYKRDLFRDIRFPNGKIFEDYFIMHNIIYKCNKIQYISNKLYFYYQSKDSISRSKFNVKKLDKIYAERESMLFFRNMGQKELRYKSEFIFINSFFKNYFKAKIEINLDKKSLKDLKNIFKKEFIFIISNPLYSYKEKIMWLIFIFYEKKYQKYISL